MDRYFRISTVPCLLSKLICLLLTISQFPSRMNIGTHCSLTTCSSLDFLPIKCSLCLKTFCKDHSTPSNNSTSTTHSCNSIDNSRNNVKGNKFDDKFNDLLPDVNRGLGEDYDEKEREKLKRKVAAQDLIKKNFGSKVPSASSSIETVSTTSAKKKIKVNPVIELMKLKQRAKQGDPRKSTGEISMEQRVYFKVIYLEQEGEAAVEKSMKELWLPKVSSKKITFSHFKTDRFFLSDYVDWKSSRFILCSLWNRER